MPPPDTSPASRLACGTSCTLAARLTLSLLALGCGAGAPRVPTSPLSEVAEPAAPRPTPRALPPSVEVPAGALALIAELDQLGYPSLQGLVLVRVHTGREVYDRRGSSREDVQTGWLLEEAGDEFTVVHGLEPVTYRTRARYSEHDVRYEVAAWTEVLDRALTVARAEAEREGADDGPMIAGRHAAPRLAALFLARGAIANGHERRGRELLLWATRMGGPSMPFDRDEGGVAALRGDAALHLLRLAMAA